ncbi:hypothetical protein C0992_003427 [Termitomyces sp. T32_za158]|nr:hypothetical protein C0992_003427 [Termitomyces sp. T32_za158]
MKKRMLTEIEEGDGPSPSPFPKPPPLGGIENKENQTPPRSTSVHSQSPARRIPSLRNKLLDAVAHPKPPSSSPNLFNEGSLSRSPPLLKAQGPSVSRTANSDPPSSPSPRDATAASPHSSPTVVGTVSKPPSNKFLNSVGRTNASLSSPSVSNSSSCRKPLVFEPITAVRPRSITTTHGKQERDIGWSQPTLAKQQDPTSSETEEEVQVIDVDPSLVPARPSSPPQVGLTTPLIPTSPAPILSSETEADSQSQMFSLPFLDPTPCPARPAKASLLQPLQSASVPAQAAFPRDRRVVSSADEESLRVRKARRVSEDFMTAGPELKSTVTSEEGKEGKGKDREDREEKSAESDLDVDLDVEALSSTPANPPPTAQRRAEDYSVYKGRGRYGKNAAPKDTINAQFEINPSRNGGLNYKYDEVVRAKRDRKQMEAGDCECCRDVCLGSCSFPRELRS